ncbi:NAD(P)/FAD-dependent oxidoreductase [Aspergillus clavatus NRRL 1]|uniref:Thioredoxin reductase, putative n=1 Tax=Aspergillus clavatus (strain ATCC 1007 / CBS 513.65 / DSM 816 / NCTC 3887 / NRRL 1 / QM 1276 / 107) TaxID=344612 RepID=A1C4Y4_ASPCL|nr:thioredoxin reductase, putative [Aspergillus clavatus NRRL 1]EAW14752.1 thioredoxin reductase, putative [Aspergillus clavatus NRRL 1]
MAPNSLLYTVFSSLTVALAASIPRTEYEVMVIGGGPAGLSVASGLSRIRRKNVLFDSGEYRNGPTRNMHDVIGNDGAVPSAFRGLAREQISHYNQTTFIDKKVDTVTIVTDEHSNSTYFSASVAGASYTARKLILGTGMKDILPDTPGLEEAWGMGVYWCPWCDGWEHRDQPFGILGPLPEVVGAVLEVYTLNTDIIAFVNGTQTPENEAKVTAKYPSWEKQLQAYNIRIDNGSIASFERLQDGAAPANRDDEDCQFDIFKVNMASGASVERSAFITNFPSEQRSSIPHDLGLEMQSGKIATNINGMRTSLPGVFAVGDANSDNSTNVPHAMFSGKRAAVYVHVEMAREESQAAISKRTLPSRQAMEKEAERRMGGDLEQLWDRVRRV